MAVEVNDNEKIQKLTKAKNDLHEIGVELFSNHGVNIACHQAKIENLIDNAIRKERINILNEEIEKIKKGEK